MSRLDLQPEDTLALIACAVAAAAIILAGWLAESRTAALERCRTQADTIAGLRDALADARYERTARHVPIDLAEWTEPDPEPVRPRRRHWHTRLTWPGLNAGRLPFGYDGPLDPARLAVDPCLPPPALTDAEVLAWRVEPQAQSWPPLTPGELLVEQALVAFEAASPATRELETLDA